MVALRDGRCQALPQTAATLKGVDRRVKDLSVHRTTVRLFEPAAPLRIAVSWVEPSQTVRLLVLVLAGFVVLAASSQGLFAEDGPGKKPAEKKPAKAGQPEGDDSQATAEEPTVFSISKPLSSDEAWKKWSEGKDHRDFTNRIDSGELDRDTMQVISNGIREQVYAMTLPTQRDNLGALVAGILRSVHSAALQKNGATQRATRAAMMREIIKWCHDLGDNQFYVRLNATILLGNLFIVPENPVGGTPPEFFDEAFAALMEVLNRPGQPEGIKLAAVNGLRNAALYCNPPLVPSQKIELATKLKEELEKPDTCEWYQARICETLGSLDQINDLDGRPFIVHALAKALFDHNRPLYARAAAAKALGRAQLPSTIDLNVVAYGIADLSRQIVETRNDRKKHVSRWCITDVFLAFRPKDRTENARRAGLLSRVDEPTFQKFKGSIKEVYRLILPMVKQELKEADSAFPPQIEQQITDWLKNHIPAQMRVAPGLPLITTTQLTKTESAR
jgi:hypothetical protein